MSVTIEKFSKTKECEWDDFIPGARNSTILHSRKFFNHNPLNQIDDHSLMFYKKGVLIGLLPAALHAHGSGMILHSHPRCTYGGFVIGPAVGASDALEIVEATIEYAESLKVNEIIIRNSFRIYHKMLSDEIDYAMWRYGFLIKSRELEVAILLDDRGVVTKRFDESTSRSIKKAYKSVKVELSDDYEGYWKILEENLRSKHGVGPTHNIDEYRRLIQNLGENNFKLFLVFMGSEIIGGIAAIIANQIVLHSQYIAYNYKYQEHRPLNAVIDFMIDWAIDHGFKYLNLGMATEPGGMAINEGLFRFKEGFGGRSVLRETSHLILTKDG